VPEFDVFLSYGHGDVEWVGILADNLTRLGLEVYLDAYELVSGELLAIHLQEALARSRTVVLVVSRNISGHRWVEEEFAAALAGVVAGTQRLIPVLLGEIALPPFVASRTWVDFRAVATPTEYETALSQLVAAVREQPSRPRPAVGEPLVMPAGLATAEAPATARLTIGRDRVSFSTTGGEVSHAPDPIGNALVDALYELDAARRRPVLTLPDGELSDPPLRGIDPTAGTMDRVSPALVRVGRLLGETFLSGSAGTALLAECGRMRARNSSLRLGIHVTDQDLAQLPWETLVIPNTPTPLSLTDRVEIYRHVEPNLANGVTVALQVPGPLKILAVIASPIDSKGELLDYEDELRRILDAVEASRGDRAQVRLLRWGTLAAIQQALDAERFHVLHLSCHAAPGRLQLETPDGRLDEVDLDEFVSEALPSDRGVPLIVLSGCSTALTPASDPAVDGEEEEGQGQLLGNLAEGLVRRGVPAVLAMTAPVTDGYATALTADLYRQLAGAQRPNPLSALSRARRALEQQRTSAVQNHRAPGWAEWATPVLVASRPGTAWFDTADPQVRLVDKTTPDLGTDMVVRAVGDFVGRRSEEHTLAAALRDDRHAGVLIHGIGGVGKSSLTAQLLLNSETDHLIVPVNGATAVSVDAILETLRGSLVAECLTSELPEHHPLWRVADYLANAARSWQQRLGVIRQIVLPRVRVLLLIDNAETLLVGGASLTGANSSSEADISPDVSSKPVDGFTFTDPALAAFLAEVVKASATTHGRIKLLITSRYPIALPEQRHRRLRTHHLGPLSAAETRKLIWRLPGLDALSTNDKLRAIADVGGHPRALEYLDALLNHGHARFADIDDKLRATLNSRGIHNPDAWLAHAAQPGLDAALAETITLAVDDTLLDTLLDRLSQPARQLLYALAPYRRPANPIAVAWAHHGPERPLELDAELIDRLTETRRILERDQETSAEAGEDVVDEESLTDQDRQRLIASYRTDLHRIRTPPVDSADNQVASALEELTLLGLIAPLQTEVALDETSGDPGPSTTCWFVHRWTSSALLARMTAQQLQAGHLRAAAYYRWHADVWPQDSLADIYDLLEVRHHYQQAGETASALACQDAICSRLDAWGAWEWSRRLYEEALGWVIPGSREEAVSHHQLGLLAQRRGDYPTAQTRYHDALAIREALGDRAGVAASYHQLGNLAYLRGDYPTAEDRYRNSLAIFEEVGDRAGIVASYGQLGMLAHARGDYATAETHYRNSLAVSEELGDQASVGTTYHQLGVLAHDRGDQAAAETHYRNSLAISEELGNRAGIALSYGQLGVLAHDRGDQAAAETHYRNSLAISEELGDQAGIAASCHQLGVLAQQRGDSAAAESYYRSSLAISEELGDLTGMAKVYHQLGVLAQQRGDSAAAESYYRSSLAISEELGDQAGIAASYHQFGLLAHDRGDSAEAMRYQLQSLTMHLALGAPDIVTNLYILQGQREFLGEDAFRHNLDQLMEPEQSGVLLQMLDQVAEESAAESSDEEDTTRPPDEARGARWNE
jgi:tetratricopeptide (TPR) repeat protein